MCGLVGAAGNLGATDERAFRTLLILDQLRGIDSTGVAVVKTSGEVKMLKTIGNAYDLFENKGWDKLFHGFSKVLIGHNRFATMGKPNKTNAHPFEFDTLVGAHNGTLTSKYRFKNSIDFDVDSQAMYNHIDKEGLASALENMEGAWALTWWDKLTSTINFLRNKERPLWLTETEGGPKRIFWASELWMLEVALAREGIKYEEPVLLKVDEHLSFEVNGVGLVGKPHIRHSPSTYKPSVWQGSAHHQGGGRHNTPPFPGSIKETCAGKDDKKITAENSCFNKVDDAKILSIEDGSKKKSVQEEGSNVVVLSSKDLYGGSKNVLLEVISEARDTYGAFYLTCFDKNNPSANVRLYVHKNDSLRSYLGKELIADIGYQYFRKTEGTYYKVEYSSVRSLDAVNRYIQSQMEDECETEDVKPSGYKDHHGDLIDKKEWTERYGVCACCTGVVEPDLGWRFTIDGDAVCHVCMEDTELAAYLPIIH